MFERCWVQTLTIVWAACSDGPASAPNLGQVFVGHALSQSSRVEIFGDFFNQDVAIFLPAVENVVEASSADIFIEGSVGQCKFCT